ncbi:MAG: dipeptidase [Candidatus Eremiobacteraeota bacterium]|nr:dipeptidase [Candidatus Eremiobacteraeota bacterium]
MKRLAAFLAGMLFAVLCREASPAGEARDPALWQRALAIHRGAIVIDTHCDTPLLMVDEHLDIGTGSKDSEVDIPKMIEGGLSASFFAVFVPNSLDGKGPAKKALEIIDEIYLQAGKNRKKAELAFSADDIVRVHSTGKKAILIGMENGGPLEGSLGLLRDFYRLGVRYITLTHIENNDICDSSTAQKARFHGLSPFGRSVVREMNRLGMIIDVSHISDEAFRQVMDLSEAPVMASHSSVRALCSHPRNLSDEMMKALAAKGGLVQITFYSEYLDEGFLKKIALLREKIKPEKERLKKKYRDDPARYRAELTALWNRELPPPVPVEVLINHIDYAVKLVGADHVGLGSDYDGAGSYPAGLENAAHFPLITYHLLKRGYKEEDIRKILGGNVLRLMREVEQRRTHYENKSGTEHPANAAYQNLKDPSISAACLPGNIGLRGDWPGATASARSPSP